MTSQCSLLDQAVSAALEIRLERVPEDSLRRISRIVADTVGVSIGGFRQPEMVRLVALERERGIPGTPQGPAASVFGCLPMRADPERAAFLNATAGSFIELDEGMRPTGHPGMQVAVPAIAAAEVRKVPGQVLLRAVLIGYEVTARLFTAYRLTYPVHPHGHFGAIGGAVAVATITGADPVEAARIAATSPILSVWDACYEGATARNTWMGSAAELALRSSRLAEAGFTGTSRGLESSFGQIAGSLVDETAMSRPLDYASLGVSRNYFKVHSACALTHAAADAVLQMEYVAPGDIKRVLVETVKNNMKLDRQAVPNALSARFSLPYFVAAVLLRRGLDADTFAFDEETAELAERVEVVTAPDLEARWPVSSPARVTRITAEGQETVTVQDPHGYYTDPLSDQELADKFHRLVADSSVAECLWQRFADLSSVEDCSKLFECK